MTDVPHARAWAVTEHERNGAARTEIPVSRVPRGYLDPTTRRSDEAQSTRGAPATATGDPFARKCSEEVIRAAPEMRNRVVARLSRALCRTRTGDPFLTMEVLYQLS